MKGLIEKDIRLLLKRKQTLLLFLGLAIFMSFSSGAFAVAYTTFLVTLMSVSTINYDEFDNGYAFLMTLPITREKYVRSKYVLCIAGGIIAWFAAVVIFSLVYFFRGVNANLWSSIPGLIIYFPLAVICADLMIPLEIKFGAEKSRIAMAVVVVLFGTGGLLLAKLFTALDADGSLTEKLNGIPDVVFLSALFALFALLTAISYLISVKIMNKKEI